MRGIIMSLCDYCGSEIPADAGFCGICGRTNRSVEQAASGYGSYAAANRGMPDPTSNAGVPDSQRRSARRPYQYTPPSPQQYPQPGAEPTARYAPATPVAAPVQQAPRVASAEARPGAQPYPYAQPQGPIRIGSPTPNGVRPVKPRRPAYKRKGCLVSLGVVLLLLVVFFSIAIPTVQKVMAFGSAISTQAPLSTQTSYMGGSDRVNILMIGYGAIAHHWAYLTNSMFLMSLLPHSHHTTLISIPRDLWIQDPPNSGNYNKINAVYPIASNNNADPVAGGERCAQKG